MWVSYFVPRTCLQLFCANRAYNRVSPHWGGGIQSELTMWPFTWKITELFDFTKGTKKCHLYFTFLRHVVNTVCTSSGCMVCAICMVGSCVHFDLTRGTFIKRNKTRKMYLPLMKMKWSHRHNYMGGNQRGKKEKWVKWLKYRCIHF